MTTGDCGTPVVQQVSPNTLITGESVAVKGQTQDGCTNSGEKTEKKTTLLLR